MVMAGMISMTQPTASAIRMIETAASTLALNVRQL
jgi:hypothetical protein